MQIVENKNVMKLFTEHKDMEAFRSPDDKTEVVNVWCKHLGKRIGDPKTYFVPIETFSIFIAGLCGKPNLQAVK